MKYITLYAKKGFVSSLTAIEMKSLLQLFRIQNALNYHMNRLSELQKQDKSIHKINQQIEETFIPASLIKEAGKELFGNGQCLSTLNHKMNDQSVKEKYKSLKQYFDNYKNEPNLQLLELIRNNFSFHFKQSIYDGNIHEGEAIDDMLISISLSEKNGDMLYIGPGNAMLHQIKEFSIKQESESPPEVFLYDVVLQESFRIYQYLNEYLRSFLKGQVYKKKEEI